MFWLGSKRNCQYCESEHKLFIKFFFKGLTIFIKVDICLLDIFLSIFGIGDKRSFIVSTCLLIHKKAFKDEIDLNLHVKTSENENKITNKDSRMKELKNWLDYLKVAA